MRNAFFAKRSDDALVGAGVEFIVREDRVRDETRIDRIAGEHRLESDPRRNLPRHLIRRDGRKHAERDLRQCEARAIGSEDEVTRHRELAAAAERGSAHEGDGDEIETCKRAEAVVKIREHRDDAVAEVVLHARAGGEGLVAGGVNDERVTIVRNAAERVAQLGEHRDVENVQRRIVERDAIGVCVG